MALNVDGAKRYLLVTPCDPGNCHIYFGVQRRALATAVALAQITGRTLLIPPPEWYPDQAQQFANAFMNSPQGRVPQFVRWSELYDIDRLRHAATASLLSRRDSVIIASVSCIYGLGSPDAYYGLVMPIEKGQRIDRDQILEAHRPALAVEHDQVLEVG